MTLVKLLQPNLERLCLYIDAAYVSDHFSLPRRLIPHLIHPVVELGEAGEEFGAAGYGFQFGGDERLHREAVRTLHLQPRQPCQNDKFTRDVSAIEVVAGVRLREPLFLRLPDHVAPFAALAVHGREAVEEEAHGAGEDALDAVDAVAGVDEVFEGGDDGEAGADGGFVVDEAAGLVVGGRGVEDIGPEPQTAGKRLLIWRHDADALGQKGRVGVRDILAARVVDEDALAREFGEKFEGLGDCERGRSGCFEVAFPGCEGERGGAVGGAEGFCGAGDEDEGEVGELLAEEGELGEEVAADAAGSWGFGQDVMEEKEVFSLMHAHIERKKI